MKISKMLANELRKRFLGFFKEKGHTIVPSSSLLPADPTSLFTSAGMQQFVPYLAGEQEPPYKRACSLQKCLRVGDIEEVGDNTHHTFFEMLGNWSFNDYFKEEAIDWALEFLLGVCELDKSRLWVSVFRGEQGIPKDEQAIKLWMKRGFPKQKICELGMKDNFWGPVAKTGPCGPCSEIFYDTTGLACAKGKKCGLTCECGRLVEIWNLVFMEYNKTIDGKYEKMNRQNVDTGMGFERMLSILQQKESAYETDLFWPVIQELKKLSGARYEENKKAFRVIAEHLRAGAFVISESVLPSNLDRGYVLRRLLRKAIMQARGLLFENWHEPIVEKIVEIYGSEYKELAKNKENIKMVIKEEKEKFEKSLDRGLLELGKILIEAGELREDSRVEPRTVPGFEAFRLYSTYSIPLELIEEEAEKKGFRVDKKGFEREKQKHQEISRHGAAKKFGGVGIDQIEDQEQKKQATRLHTATHLLHQALRTVLGEHVRQMGSDITPERLRFDFSHSEKLSDEQIAEIEALVNERIEEGLVVSKQELPYEQAIESGALAFFKEKYPKQVFVYTIKDKAGKVVSKEICAGPHAKTTAHMGNFRIIKQESAGAGIRRIKAILGD